MLRGRPDSSRSSHRPSRFGALIHYDSFTADYEDKEPTFCGVHNKEALRWHCEMYVLGNIVTKQAHQLLPAKHE